MILLPTLRIAAMGALLPCLLQTGCANAPTAALNDDFTVHVGETISVKDASLSVRFVRVVEDSRCPSLVQCIWAGNGKVELEVRSSGQVSIIYLNTFEGPKAATVGAYRLALQALDPAPKAPGPISASKYRVTLTATD